MNKCRFIAAQTLIRIQIILAIVYKHRTIGNFGIGFLLHRLWNKNSFVPHSADPASKNNADPDPDLAFENKVDPDPKPC